MQLQHFIQQAFPHDEDTKHIIVESAEDQTLCLRLSYHERFLRPGQTIAGPTLMKLADTAVYLCLVHQDVEQATSVTSSLHMDFLRRPPASDLIVEATILKLGRLLSTVVVSIFDDEQRKLVAHATATYARNPEVRIPEQIRLLLAR